MAKGEKLSLDIGAKIGDGWSYDGETFREKNKTTKETNNKILSIKEHILVFRYEKRNGKDVTLVGQFYLEKAQKETILKDMKKKLGVGGSIKDEWIELQGKLEEKVKAHLQAQGFKFRK